MLLIYKINKKKLKSKQLIFFAPNLKININWATFIDFLI